LISRRLNNPQGIVAARICQLNVVDHDSDVIRPGTLTGQSVLVGQWNHSIWEKGFGPVGRGELTEENGFGVLDAQFWLDIPEKRSTFLAVKHASELQEWSWSLEDTVSRPIQHNGKTVNEITATRIRECSPVTRAASIGTATLSAKGHCTCGGGNALPPQLAEEMKAIRGELLRRDWLEREKLKGIHLRLIRDQVRAAQYEAIRDEMAAAKYLWGL
jgi:hypothetical protein